MPFPIWIGVDSSGSPLIGAIDVNNAKDRGSLHNCERVYPSQLRYRICVFYPESGAATFGSVKVAGGKRRQLPGKWRIVRRTDAHKDADRMIALYGLGDPDHEFPSADGSRTSRRKVSP